MRFFYLRIRKTQVVVFNRNYDHESIFAAFLERSTRANPNYKYISVPETCVRRVCFKNRRVDYDAVEWPVTWKSPSPFENIIEPVAQPNRGRGFDELLDDWNGNL